MTKASPRTVGAFVVGGIALLIAGIFAFGSLQLLKDHISVVMRFDEDLTGLDPGAPVTFRGVQIGTVTKIALVFNADTRTFQSPVHVQIEPDRFQIEGSLPRLGQNLAHFIEQGLRARLASQSILTGKRLIEVGFHPDTPVRLAAAKSDIPEVPTIPSQLEQLQAGLGGLFRKLEQTALPELVSDLRTTVQALHVVISELDTARFSDDASEAFRSGRVLFDNFGKHLDAIAPKGEAAVRNADLLFQELQKAAAKAGPALAGMQRAIEHADRLVADANVIIEPGSPTHRELMAALREISGAARSMRALTDDLERNPNSLVFGKTSVRGR
jgi:paraquat-inducible protein B